MNISDTLGRLVAPASQPKTLREALWNRRFAIAFLVSWGLALGIRLLELDTFLTDSFLVDGERMVATHDGYAFLAGAQGTSRYVIEPLSHFVAFLHSVTGVRLGDLGFWLPPLFAGLAALPVCAACARLGRAWAGAAAGLLATTCYAFYIRSRIGFLDTDMLTLFLAYGTSAAMILWLAPQCRNSWLPTDGDDRPGDFPMWKALAGAACIGLFLFFYMRFYSSGRPLILAVTGTMGAVGLLLARPGNRTGMLLGLTVLLGGMDYGLWAAAPALALAGVAYRRPEALRAHHVGTVGAVVALALVGGAVFLPGVRTYYDLLLVYLNLSGREIASQGAEAALSLPSVMATVREATHVPFSDVMWLMSGKTWIFFFALPGYIWALARRPMLAAFLPLGALALGCPWLGTRFAMYGGGALGLGLAFLVGDGVAMATHNRWIRLGAQGALVVLLALVLGMPVRDLPQQQVLSPKYAETLKKLGEIAAPDAVLWQWWDFGYAAQYYAGRDSFGDGGRHSGDWVYPLAVAHASTSPTQSANMIAYTAADIAAQVREQKELGVQPYPPAKLEYFPVDPMRGLAAMEPAQAEDFVDSLALARPELPAKAPEQYLVLGWENLLHLGVISSFGHWSLESGVSLGGKSSPVPGGAINFQRGVLRARTGQTTPLSGMILVDKDNRIRKATWMHFGAPYAIANMASGELYAVDSRVFNSMMVQLLLGDPADFGPQFTLVVDNAPWCRAYRVN